MEILPVTLIFQMILLQESRAVDRIHEDSFGHHTRNQAAQVNHPLQRDQ